MNRRNFLKRAGLGAAGAAGAVLMPGVLRDEPVAIDLSEESTAMAAAMTDGNR